MAKDKKGFMLYADQKSLFDKLPDEIAGKLIKHIYSYVNDENPNTDDILIEIAFEPIKTQLKRDLKKYQATCKKNKENIEKRWNKKDTTVYKRIPKDTKHTDKDNDIDKDNDKDKDNVINYREIKEIFNSVCFNLPKIQKITEVRKKAIKARAEEYSLIEIGNVFKIVAGSDFLIGKNDNNWKATFDWILKPANFIKILEGNYKNINNKNEQRTEKLKQLAKITAENFGEKE